MKKFIAIGACILLTGCFQSSASLIGPVYTLGSSGNIYQAGLSYGVNQTIQKTTSNIFDTLFKALATLFAGYVGIKGVDGIKDWLQGDRSTLKSLGKEVALVLTAAAGVFTAVTVGMPLITAGIGGVIGAVVGGLPAAFSLLGNPYVWMGIIAATGAVLVGQELYKYLSGEYGSMAGGFSGRGTYSKDRQIWIDRVYEVGQEAAIGEMDQKVAAIAKKYPMLFEADGVTPKGCLLYTSPSPRDRG